MDKEEPKALLSNGQGSGQWTVMARAPNPVVRFWQYNCANVAFDAPHLPDHIRPGNRQWPLLIPALGIGSPMQALK